MDQPKFERFLRLIKLMTGNTSLTVEDLARKIDTTYRSIYRYIDTFKAAGFVVKKFSPGVYQLVSVNRKVPDLNKIVYFSEEEASVISRLIEGLDNTDTLKQNLLRKLSTVYECAPATDFIDRKSNAFNMRELSEAIQNRRQVILHGYKSSNSGTISDRLIEPFEFTTNHIQIWAYDCMAGESKVFSVSHIGEVETLNTEWEHFSEHRAKQTDIFRMFGDSPVHVRLRLSQRAMNCLLDEYPLSEKNLVEDSGKWILDAEVLSLRGVGRFVAGLADEIEIIEAPELKDYLKEFYDRYITTLLDK